MVSPGFYEHHAGGVYEVLSTVLDASGAAKALPEHLRRVVLYRDDQSVSYARPIAEFVEHVFDGTDMVSRFRRIGDDKDNGVSIMVDTPCLPGLEEYVHG